MKLDGLRVIDLSLFLPGPHLTMMMADHGAEVIKVEPPGEGEPNRHIGPQQDGTSVYFRNTHRGKKSLCLNLKAPEAREALLKTPLATDEAQAIELLGHQPKLVMGDSANLKVTYAPDLKLARMLLATGD